MIDTIKANKGASAAVALATAIAGGSAVKSSNDVAALRQEVVAIRTNRPASSMNWRELTNQIDYLKLRNATLDDDIGQIRKQLTLILAPPHQPAKP